MRRPRFGRRYDASGGRRLCVMAARAFGGHERRVSSPSGPTRSRSPGWTGSGVTDHYRGSCDPEDGAIRVFAISDEQLAKPPPVPHGVNVSFNIGMCFGACTGIRLPLGHPGPYQDLAGRAAARADVHLRNALSGAAGRAANRPRTARCERSRSSRRKRATIRSRCSTRRRSTERRRITSRCSRCGTRKDNRLRELWIGTEDYLPRRANLAGNFTLAPLVDVPWTVDFTVSTERRTSAARTRRLRSIFRITASFATPSSRLKTSTNRRASTTAPLVEPEATDTSLVEPGSSVDVYHRADESRRSGRSPRWLRRLRGCGAARGARASDRRGGSSRPRGAASKRSSSALVDESEPIRLVAAMHAAAIDALVLRARHADGRRAGESRSELERARNVVDARTLALHGTAGSELRLVVNHRNGEDARRRAGATRAKNVAPARRAGVRDRPFRAERAAGVARAFYSPTATRTISRAVYEPARLIELNENGSYSRSSR